MVSIRCLAKFRLLILSSACMVYVAARAYSADWNPRLAADYLDSRQKEWFAWAPAKTPGGTGGGQFPARTTEPRSRFGPDLLSATRAKDATAAQPRGASVDCGGIARGAAGAGAKGAHRGDLAKAAARWRLDHRLAGTVE